MAQKKKKHFSIRKLIYNDKYLIIFSILCALVIWVATSISLSPETTKTLTVPLEIDFSDTAADQLGLKCYGEKSVNVEVNIKCKKYLAKDITADDIKATLQTNYVVGSGVAQVPIRVQSNNSSDFEIQSYYPTYYSALFDVELQKVMDVEINYDSDKLVNDGYILGQPILSESSVMVSGPATYVSQVSTIRCDVSIPDGLLSATKNFTVTPVPYDKNGDKVDYISLLDNDGKAINLLDLTLPVLKQTQLPVAVEFINNTSKINEKLFDISYSVENVNVGVIDDVDIKSCIIGQVDFSKLNVGKNEFTFDMSNIEGLIILDDIEEITAIINVPDDFETGYVDVSENNVKVSNMPEGYSCEVFSISKYSVTSIGRADDLKNINPNNVALTVNANQEGDITEEGVYTLDISPSIEGSSGCWIYGDYTATIRIFKK